MRIEDAELLISRHLDEETTEAENREIASLRDSDPDFAGLLLRAQQERSAFDDIRAADARHRPSISEVEAAMSAVAHRAKAEAQQLRALERGTDSGSSAARAPSRVSEFFRSLFSPIPNLSGALSGAVLAGVLLLVVPQFMPLNGNPGGPGSEQSTDGSWLTRSIDRPAKPDGSPIPPRELAGGETPVASPAEEIQLELSKVDAAIRTGDYEQALAIALKTRSLFPELVESCTCASYRLNISLARVFQRQGQSGESGQALVRAGTCLGSSQGREILACLNADGD